jgi:hypothetical protein
MAAIVDEKNPADVLQSPGPHSLLWVRYEPGPQAVPGTAYPVKYCSSLGSPPVAVVLVVSGLDVVPSTSSGKVAFSRNFLRGDADQNGQVNLSDSVSILTWLFRGGDEPSCVEAADSNGNRQVNIADPIYLLQHLFVSGPAPQAPFPACGPASVALGCEASACEP